MSAADPSRSIGSFLFKLVVVTIVHFVLTGLVGAMSFSAHMRNFDGPVEPRPGDYVLMRLSEAMMMPIALPVMKSGLTGRPSPLLFPLNSFVSALVLVYLGTMLTKTGGRQRPCTGAGGDVRVAVDPLERAGGAS